MTDHDISGHEEDSPETSEGDGFDTLGLRPELLKTINDLGYEEPTPIQRQTIPHLLAGETCWAKRQPARARPRRSRCPRCR